MHYVADGDERMSHRMISSEGLGDHALRAEEHCTDPGFLDLPPSAYGAAWLYGGGSGRALFLLAVGGRTLGFTWLKCHQQWENGFTTNSSCVSRVMLLCV